MPASLKYLTHASVPLLLLRINGVDSIRIITLQMRKTEAQED